MTGKGRFFAAVLILIISVFVIGIYGMIATRIETGDIYPPYSSYRSDPLGTKGLYLAFERLPSIKVRRSFLEAKRLLKEKGVTIFCLGVNSEVMRLLPKEELENLEKLAESGNRLIIGFSDAENVRGAIRSAGKCDPKEGCPKTKESTASLADRWSVTFDRFPMEKKAVAEPMRAIATDGTSGSITVRSDLFFKTDGTSWRTVYSVGSAPVVIERKFGTGSIVLLSDSYLMSNEAMKTERYPGLFVWLQGNNRTVLFDEYHLGVREDPGIMWLVGKYRLGPFFIALLMLGGLFVWKNAMIPVPSRVSDRTGTNRRTTDKDSISGLVSLLRRNVPSAELLDICLREWEKSFSREYRGSAGLLQRIRSLVDEETGKAPGARDPAAGYRKIARILAERKR